MSRTAIHPGVILADELKELGIKPTVLARELHVTPSRISQIISGKRNITPDTALRFGKWFDTSASFWLNLQTNYELRLAQKEISKELSKIPTRAHKLSNA